MLKLPYIGFGLAILLALMGNSLAQPLPESQPQNKYGPLSAQQSPAQPAPSVNLLTPEQITKAIADGINAAAKQYETRNPASPPDNSGWWFNFLLVVFTGGLVVVGAGQCYLIFWTLKATEKAANAAADSAKIAEQGMLTLEIPYLYPFIRSHKITVSVSKKTGRLGVTGFALGNDLITYYFKNFGRTPAEIIEVFSLIRSGIGIPPPIPIAERPYNPLSGFVVTSESESNDFVSPLPQAIFEAMNQGRFDPDREIVWFTGYVRYNDVFENEYVRGFSLAFSPDSGKFYPIGGDGYNYRKKTKTAGQPQQPSEPVT